MPLQAICMMEGPGLLWWDCCSTGHALVWPHMRTAISRSSLEEVHDRAIAYDTHSSRATGRETSHMPILRATRLAIW